MVYRSHGGQVWRAVLAMTAGRGDLAEEATAEAFAQLYAHPEKVRDPVAWVFRTAFRLAAREQQRERKLVSSDDTGVGSVAPLALPSDLSTALRALTPQQRVAVFLHYFADLSVGEIANLTGSPVATVKVRLHRARKALRESRELVADV